MTPREVTLHVAQGAAERGAQESLDYWALKAQLDRRDRAFATNLAFGAIKMRRLLEWILHPYIGKRGKPLPPAISEILRLATYELRFTRGAPHAVVSEWVNLAKRYGHRGTAGLVNAVLRSLLRDPAATPAPQDFSGQDDYLGTVYSYPTWVVRQWRLVFGDARLEEILTACNAPAQPAVVVNRKKETRDRLCAWFAEKGASAQASALAEDSVLVDDGSAIAAAEAGGDGKWWRQSESSAMVVDILNPQPGERVVDACSGRGNKALQIAARLAGGEAPICIDRDPRKIATLEKRAASSDLSVAPIAGDATAPILPGRADRILVDAPCSGIGVLGRHPEARWQKRPDDGERLALTQRALLESLTPQLFEGGAIVYAVCSTDPRETTEVVDWMLRTHNVQRGLVPSRYAEVQTELGDLLIPPGLQGRDGFYIARLERRL
ncbi:MAG TPA: transcription antitermination factor NusB [Candidatus Rubrimentiphilum sp.]|nr:transcription antitermination factor NusB [Candidatus Rubrimentiphilum sp.]